MDQTGYNIARARFFGVEADESLTLKQDAKFFYSHNSGSPAKVAAKPQSSYATLQENVSTNVIQRNRSPIGNAGNKILRSSSTSVLNDKNGEEQTYQPVIGRITKNRAKNTYS